MRVLCVDDHEVLVEGLKAKFAIENRIRIVGHLTSATDLVEGNCGSTEADLVVLDIEKCPGPMYLKWLIACIECSPPCDSSSSVHIRDGYLAAAYKCGAWGYFAKGDELDDIVAGIKTLAGSKTGTFVMGPKVRARVRRCKKPPDPQPQYTWG